MPSRSPVNDDFLQLILEGSAKLINSFFFEFHFLYYRALGTTDFGWVFVEPKFTRLTIIKKQSKSDTKEKTFRRD